MTYGDWSSDVCSSDLEDLGGLLAQRIDVSRGRLRELGARRARRGVGDREQADLVGALELGLALDPVLGPRRDLRAGALDVVVEALLHGRQLLRRGVEQLVLLVELDRLEL